MTVGIHMLRRVACAVGVFALVSPALAQQAPDAAQYKSAFLSVGLSPDQPAFVSLSVDSLGTNKLGLNPLRRPEAPGAEYKLAHRAMKYEYRAAGALPHAQPAWVFEFSERKIRLRSVFSSGNAPPALVLNFNSHLNHATLLGLMNDEGNVRLPTLLHMPDQGTLRITSNANREIILGYEAHRFDKPRQDQDFVKVTFPGASAALPKHFSVEPTLPCSGEQCGE
jgi:hypothetical protein